MGWTAEFAREVGGLVEIEISGGFYSLSTLRSCR